MKTQVTVLILAMVICFSCSPYPDSYHIKVPGNDGTIVFEDVHVIPMTEEVVLKNYTVVVNAGRILEIGPSGLLKIPPGARKINAAGKYLMPGLADMHVHTRDQWNKRFGGWPVSPLLLFLANGVTTIRSFGHKPPSKVRPLDWKIRIDQGEWAGPKMYSSGPIIYGPVSEPEQRVRQQKASGFDFIKLYSFLSDDSFHRAVQAAKQEGLYTAGHIPFPVGLDGVISAGMNEIAHVEELAWELIHYDKNKKVKGRQWLEYVVKMAFQQYLELYKGKDMQQLEIKMDSRISSIAEKIERADIPVSTTLFLDEVIVKKLHHPKQFLSKPVNRYLPKSYIAAFRQGQEKHQRQFRGGEEFAIFKHKVDLILLKHLKKANVRLLLGTDAGTGGMGLVPGFSIHDELRVLAENGFTPYEAIKTATVTAAEAIHQMNGQGDFGTLEAGKRADLILLESNPLNEIENTKDILGVMASGRWYDRATLDEYLRID